MNKTNNTSYIRPFLAKKCKPFLNNEYIEHIHFYYEAGTLIIYLKLITLFIYYFNKEMKVAVNDLSRSVIY